MTQQRVTQQRESVVLTFRCFQVFCSRLGIFAHTAGTGGTNTGVLFLQNNLDNRLQLDSIDTLRHMAVNFICMVDIPLWPIYMQWNKSTRVCFMGRCVFRKLLYNGYHVQTLYFSGQHHRHLSISVLLCTTSIVLLQNTCIIKYKFCPCHHEVMMFVSKKAKP